MELEERQRKDSCLVVKGFALSKLKAGKPEFSDDADGLFRRKANLVSV
jgi:hypothetical protein